MLPDNAYLSPTDTGAMRVQGTRVGLEHLISLYRDGYTAEELAIQYPTVTLEKVHGVIAYYLANRQAVDEYVGQWEQRGEEAYQRHIAKPPSEAVLRIRAIAEARMHR